MAEDAAVAVQAAQQMADRFGKPVVIQSDLSVVLEQNATKDILEVVRPDWYTSP